MPARRGGSRLGTYNQQCMRAVAIYLAHQEWPDAGVDSYTEDDPTAVQQIGKFMDDIVHRSHGEILSVYNLHDFGPIATLYTFARDPGMRQKTKMTLDWIVIHHAAFFFNSHVVDRHTERIIRWPSKAAVRHRMDSTLGTVAIADCKNGRRTTRLSPCRTIALRHFNRRNVRREDAAEVISNTYAQFVIVKFQLCSIGCPLLRLCVARWSERPSLAP